MENQAVAERNPARFNQRPFGSAHVWTHETVEEICTHIAAGQSIRSALMVQFPELAEEENAKKLRHKQTSFLGAVLYGDPALNLTYQRARRMKSHTNLDRADDAVEDITTKDEAYAARVKSDVYLRTAEAWNPSEFGRLATTGAGTQITINTSLAAAPEAGQLEEKGYSIPLLNANVERKEDATPDASSSVQRP